MICRAPSAQLGTQSPQPLHSSSSMRMISRCMAGRSCRHRSGNATSKEDGSCPDSAQLAHSRRHEAIEDVVQQPAARGPHPADRLFRFGDDTRRAAGAQSRSNEVCVLFGPAADHVRVHLGVKLQTWFARRLPARPVARIPYDQIPLACGRRLCQKKGWSRVTEHLRTPPGPEGSNGSWSTGCSGPFALSAARKAATAQPRWTASATRRPGQGSRRSGTMVLQ